MRSSIAAIALLALIALFAATVAPQTLWADQDDSRLDPLFEKLRTTEDLEAAILAERRIWAIWLQHEDPDIEKIMSVGTTAMSVGAWQEARAAFDRMIELDPGYAEAWNKRATVEYALGNYEASLADIEETLKREPRHFGALAGKGLVFTAMDELESALQAFEETLEVHPNSPGARTNIERLEQALQERSI